MSAYKKLLPAVAAALAALIAAASFTPALAAEPYAELPPTSAVETILTLVALILTPVLLIAVIILIIIVVSLASQKKKPKK